MNLGGGGGGFVLEREREGKNTSYNRKSTIQHNLSAEVILQCGHQREKMLKISSNALMGNLLISGHISGQIGVLLIINISKMARHFEEYRFYI